jgi:cis-3-alkyl-4-acyloxetan-2-one decarboxylase
MVTLETIKDIYPYKQNLLALRGNIKLNYVDEGEGDPIVMVHGNPTWSFYYRNLIKEFSTTNRVIAPDNVGCGLSDKPQDYNYTLENHINNLETLIGALNLKNVTLVVHDWGGAIGFGYAKRYPTNVKKIVILNTAAFTSKHIPFRINILKTPFLGEKFVRLFNGFAWPATFMTTTKKLSTKKKLGYLLPYNNYKNRIATSRFVKDIPLSKRHPTYRTLKDIEDNLKTIDCPKLILWGGKDFCFNDHFFNKWKATYPDAKSVYFEKAGHYVLEDELPAIIKQIREFIL